MAESTRLVDVIQSRIDETLDAQAATLLDITPELAPFADWGRELLRGGKRFRALFCYWGWQAVCGEPVEPIGSGTGDLEAVVLAASALEFFQAAALVHDDIIDRSDTRRGLPAAHRRFEGLHGTSGWTGDGSDFGRSSAILLGDLLLVWSDEVFDQALSLLTNPAASRAARTEFNRMRTEVTAGQYLDILEERSWSVQAESDLLPRAQRVIVYKSAKYSVEAPLLIGAAMGGATQEQLTALSDFGLPLGVAFQLRDDLLGVFGDPATTGKPSGDDLREGKRTVLIAIARAKLPPTGRRLLDELLGDPALDDEQIRMLQLAIRDSGAVDSVEKLIAYNVGLATSAVRTAPITEVARERLLELADRASRRTS